MAMRRTSTEIAQAHVDRMARERRELWARIQADAPGLADFLVLVNKRFGRPRKLKVDWDE